MNQVMLLSCYRSGLLEFVCRTYRLAVHWQAGRSPRAHAALSACVTPAEVMAYVNAASRVAETTPSCINHNLRHLLTVNTFPDTWRRAHTCSQTSLISGVR